MLVRFPRTPCSYLRSRIKHLSEVIPALGRNPHPTAATCAAVLAAELEVRQAHLAEFREVFPALAPLLLSGPHDA